MYKTVVNRDESDTIQHSAEVYVTGFLDILRILTLIMRNYVCVAHEIVYV